MFVESHVPRKQGVNKPLFLSTTTLQMDIDVFILHRRLEDIEDDEIQDGQLGAAGLPIEDLTSVASRIGCECLKGFCVAKIKFDAFYEVESGA